MFKSVYEFTKSFSLLFFLSGIFFLFKEAYVMAFILMFSFFIIKFIDSDWAFDNFKFSNHNLVVIIVTFSLIFINLFAIYQQLKYSPIFTKVGAQERENYLKYEDSLYKAIEPCITSHNAIIEDKNNNKKISDAKIKASNNNCYKVMMTIEKIDIPAKLPSETTLLCQRNQAEFKKIAVNLATYKYDDDTSQRWIAESLKTSIKNLIINMTRIRKMMNMADTIEDYKKTFIKL